MENRFLFYFRKGDFQTYHTHGDFWEFIYVASGEYTHTINEKKRTLEHGTLCLLRPDDFHSMRMKTTDSSYIVLCVREDFFTSFFELLNEKPTDILISHELIEIALSTAAERHIREITDSYLTLRELDYDSVCKMLLLAFSESVIKSLCRKNPMYSYSKGVKCFIELLEKPENLSRSLRELIAETHYSYSHMNCIFTKEVGVSPSEYLKNERLLYAQRTLVGTTCKHSVLAETLGFSTYSRFCTFFKEKTGYTPSQYAKRNSIFSQGWQSVSVPDDNKTISTDEN